MQLYKSILWSFFRIDRVQQSNQLLLGCYSHKLIIVLLIIPTAAAFLFSKAVRLSNHVLHALLPPSSTASQRYNLRHRAHSLQLPEHSTQLSDSNFLTRMLYKTHITYKFFDLSSRHAFFLTNCIAFLLRVVGLHFVMP